MKEISAEEAVSHIKDGMTLMIGGFAANGTPVKIMKEMVKKGVKNLTVIANDGGLYGGENAAGIGKLVHAGLVKKMIASHIGLNPELVERMKAGEIEVTLVPQGTLTERIRAGGAGLGGILTPTGIGTGAAQDKQAITIDGNDFLLEKPLKADIALLRASIADESGNLFYKGSTRNFNPLMATAADLVICDCEKIVPVGEIESENVVTPGIFVDYIVRGEPCE